MWEFSFYKYGVGTTDIFEGCFCLINTENLEVKFRGWDHRPGDGLCENYTIYPKNDLERFYTILKVRKVL